LVKGAKNNPSEVIFLKFLEQVEQAKAEAITKKLQL
jgi:hypothetical protein